MRPVRIFGSPVERALAPSAILSSVRGGGGTMPTDPRYVDESPSASER